MTRFRVAIHVLPRQGLLDPQGKAVGDALHTLGFAGVLHVTVGRHLLIETEADGADAARDAASRMCDQLLANPVTEDYEIAAVTPV